MTLELALMLTFVAIIGAIPGLELLGEPAGRANTPKLLQSRGWRSARDDSGRSGHAEPRFLYSDVDQWKSLAVQFFFRSYGLSSRALLLSQN